MQKIVQALFFISIVKPLMALVLGANIRHAERMPSRGAAILAANHNSHLDTLLLMSLYPISNLHKIRPVAATDYFMRNKCLAWFALNIMHILPLERRPKKGVDTLAHIEVALKNGDILILFPEGSRGEPERREPFKTGIAHIMQRMPYTCVTAIFMQGLGKALPKGDWLPVPFFADMFVAEPFHWQGGKEATMQRLETEFQALEKQGRFDSWI